MRGHDSGCGHLSAVTLVAEVHTFDAFDRGVAFEKVVWEGRGGGGEEGGLEIYLG